MRHALLLTLMLCTVAAADEPWRVPEADLRLPLQIEGDLYARTDADVSLVLNFNELLPEGRVLADGSLALVEAQTGAKLDLRLAQGSQVAYVSGNPILRLQWTISQHTPLATRLFHLYLRTVAPGEAGAWQPLAQTFSPDTRAGTFETSFEEPDPAHPDWPLRFLAAGRDVPGEKTERVWSDQVARTGQRSLRIARTFEGPQPSNTNHPFWWAWPAPIEVREGQSVRVEGWLKAVRLKDRAQGCLALEFVNEKGERLSAGRRTLFGGSPTGDWQCLSGVATAPTGARRAALQFCLVSDEGEVYCDDVAVSLVPGSALPTLRTTPGPLELRPATAQATDNAGKVLQVALTRQAPVIDGALDDPCWATAGQSTAFEVHSKPADTPAVQTTVLACADRDALYFGFICQEPSTEHLLAKATERDGALWQDDSVELFLDTNLDRRTFYQIIVNSRGAFFDQDTGAPGLAGEKWNGPITAAAKVYPDRWTAEVRLQFVGLRLAESAGSQWGANFARSSFRGTRALYTWVKVGANFGEPARFGTLSLPFDPAADVISGRPLLAERLFFGKGEVPIEINNRRDTAAQVRAVLTADDGTQQTPLGETLVAAAPRAVTTVRIPCAFGRPGQTKLRYDLFEQPAGRLLYTTSLTQAVPESLALEPAQRVVYAAEPVTGRWVVGLDKAALPASALEFTLTPVGAAQPAAPVRITPDRTEGQYALPALLKPGEYDLTARLMQEGQAIGRASHRLTCIAGPFAGP